MLEVVFTQSFNSSMQYAAYAKHDEICCLPLALSIGDIRFDDTDNLIKLGREQAFDQLLFSSPKVNRKQDLQDLLLQNRVNFKVLLEGVRAGKSVRVWSSNNPDEACGIAWLMELFFQLKLDKTTVNFVFLPHFDLRKNSTAIQYNGWGEVAPQDIERMATAYTRTLTFAEKVAFAMVWRRLQAENAPLRAVVNGRIVSVPEAFYDSLIMQEFEHLPEEFVEAELVGNVLGHYPFGFGDSWVALRIEKMLIAPGLLIPITEPKPSDSIYRRIVKKHSNIRV